jgi:uncharacterized membrane protein YcaP (DUF421 family)
MAALRKHGIDKVSDVELAFLEVDGSISVVPKGAQVFKSLKRIRFLRRKE